MMTDELPVWLTPVELELWPTEPVNNLRLPYNLSVREGWATEPTVVESPLQTEHAFKGTTPADWLIVTFMDKADPQADIRNWVEAFINLKGFPVLAIQQASSSPPRLLEWSYQGICPPLTRQLEVDETHLYQGVVQFPDEPATLARLYILLLRRDHLAWKVALSFMSACLPEASEEIVARNDHIRAGAIFGTLQLL